MPTKLSLDTKVECWALWFCLPPLPTRREKTLTTIMTKKWFENEKRITMKDKRFSFFADPQVRKGESRPTFGTLSFARHTSQRFAKAYEPNFQHNF